MYCTYMMQVQGQIGLTRESQEKRDGHTKIFLFFSFPVVLFLFLGRVFLNVNLLRVLQRQHSVTKAVDEDGFVLPVVFVVANVPLPSHWQVDELQAQQAHGRWYLLLMMLLQPCCCDMEGTEKGWKVRCCHFHFHWYSVRTSTDFHVTKEMISLLLLLLLPYVQKQEPQWQRLVQEASTPLMLHHADYQEDGCTTKLCQKMMTSHT